MFFKKNTCDVASYIYSYARKVKGKGERYKSSYRVVAQAIVLYSNERGVKLNSNSFNANVAEDFVDFLKDRNLTKNTIKGYYEKLGYMFRRMKKDGYDVNFDFEYIDVGGEEVTSVYLTNEEILHIFSIKIKEKCRELVRDMFVCNCLIGMRFGDFKTLKPANIHNKVIIKRTNKTGTPVVVPIHYIVAIIIDKYGGFPTYQKSDFNYNKVLKTICKQAGITDKVLVERTKGHRVIRKTHKKYELVSSHTARRSFATNAYLAGIPTARIMLITGHKTEQSFFKYIKIGRIENAEILNEHPFFTG